MTTIDRLTRRYAALIGLLWVLAPSDVSAQGVAVSPAGRRLVPVQVQPQVAAPATGAAAVRSLRITNQSWEQVQDLPDDTVLIGAGERQSTVGEIKAIRALILPGAGASSAAPTPVRALARRASGAPDPTALAHQENAAAKQALAGAPANAALSATLQRALTRRPSDASAGSLALAERCDHCIYSINGRIAKYVVFTPGTPQEATRYVISGVGFGSVKGSVHLAGAFNRTPVLRVDSWSDGKIVAYFEAGFVGEMDHDGVGLVITSADGRQIAGKQEANFVATRAQTAIGIDRIAQGRIYRAVPPGLDFSGGPSSYLYAHTFAQNSASASLMQGYTDRIDLDPVGLFKPGFEVVYAEADIEQLTPSNAYRSPIGCSGQTTSAGIARLGWNRSSLFIERPMTDIHLPAISADQIADLAAGFVSFGLLNSSKLDPRCVSTTGSHSYRSGVSNLKLMVEGPAGVSPFP